MTKPKKHAPKAVKGWAVVTLKGLDPFLTFRRKQSAELHQKNLNPLGKCIPVLITPLKRKAKR